MPLTKVSSGVIAANAVVDSFGTQSITGDKLGLTAINANNIVNASITGAKIALGTITGDDIATGQITGNLLTANCVSGNNIVSSPTITGNVTINGSLSLGGATTPSSGVGIKFPGTQVASTDANTLDDYEEGTFTLTITPLSGSLTSYDRYGYYVKIGRSVTIIMAFSIITTGTASGVADFSGLPFTSLNPTALAAGGNRAGTLAVREDGATGNWFFGFVNPNATDGRITTSTNGAITWTSGYAYVTSFVYESAS